MASCLANQLRILPEWTFLLREEAALRAIYSLVNLVMITHFVYAILEFWSFLFY